MISGEENLSLMGGGEGEMIVGTPEHTLMELMPPVPVVESAHLTALVSPVPAPVPDCILSPSVPPPVNVS